MNGTTAKYGLMAEFETTAATLHAAEIVRDAGYRRGGGVTPLAVDGVGRGKGLGGSSAWWSSPAGAGTRSAIRLYTYFPIWTDSRSCVRRNRIGSLRTASARNSRSQARLRGAIPMKTRP